MLTHDKDGTGKLDLDLFSLFFSPSASQTLSYSVLIGQKSLTNVSKNYNDIIKQNLVEHSVGSF